MSRFLQSLIIASSLSRQICTQAHMQIAYPYPLRSPLDPSVPVALKDYSMTSPLLADGSNFPCKQYQYNDTNPQAYDIKATYQTGGSYNLTLAGTATHMGGSCQISLSYDNGASFKVIQSLIGGCPLDPTLNFTIPSFAPPSDTALLSWSWFNLIGNREMYQNCVRVQIQSTPMQRYKRNTVRSSWKRQASIDELPDMFACDVGNGCTTVEGEDVEFPNPGDNVQYGTDATVPSPGSGFTLSAAPTGDAFSTVSPTGSSQTTPAPYPLSNNSASVGPTGSGYLSSNGMYTTTSQPTFDSILSTLTGTVTATASPTPSVTPSPTSPVSTSSMLPTSTTTASNLIIARQTNSTYSTMTTTTTYNTLTTSPSPSTTLATSALPSTTLTISPSPPTTLATSASPSTTLSSSTPSAPSSSPVPPSGPCTPGTFTCNSPTTFSQCTASNTYTFMGSVALGMQCLDGQIIRQNDGPCTPSGALFCNGETRFYLCDQGGLIDMGAVASGTVCMDGEIVAA